ncbi:MAG: HypC/HybG/HupF family hydrogenase formation chaperone [Candidatus Dormibacteria bacterium]
MNTCDGGVCITCSDQLLEAVVVAVAADGATARATVEGAECEISVELLDAVATGDHVLVHGGVALQPGRLDAAP